MGYLFTSESVSGIPIKLPIRFQMPFWMMICYVMILNQGCMRNQHGNNKYSVLAGEVKTKGYVDVQTIMHKVIGQLATTRPNIASTPIRAV